MSFLGGSRIVLLSLTVGAAAEAAPLQPVKPLPGPIGPAIPRPYLVALNCLTTAADGAMDVGADATGTTTLTPRNHDKDCPSSVIVDFTVHPEAAHPTTPTGAPNVFWSFGVGLGVSDSREAVVGDSFYIVASAKSAKACEDFKHTSKVYRRAQNETAWTLAAEGTSTAQWEGSLARCLVRRANQTFRAQPPAAGQLVYYRTVDTLPNGPTGAVTAKWHHDRQSNNTE